MKTNSEDNVYPAHYTDREGDIDFTNSLTKREYFAVTILQGLVSNSLITQDSPKSILNLAVTYADKLIERLNKENEE